VEVEPLTDIAVLTLQNAVSYAPLRIDVAVPDIGSRVCAWGHPLGTERGQGTISDFDAGSI